MKRLRAKHPVISVFIPELHRLRLLAGFIVGMFFCLLTSYASADITTGLVGWWKLDDASGTVAVDSSIYHNNGTLQNIASPATATSGWTKGKFGGALHLDGSDDYVSMGNPLIPASYSLSAWVKADSIDVINSNTIVAFTSNAGHGFLMEAGDGVTRKIRFLHRMPMGDTGGDSFYSNSDILLNVWQHIVETRDSVTKVMKIYINGVLDKSVTGTNGDFSGLSSMAVGRLGVSMNYRKWDGLIDDVRIYNRALTAGEVLDLYNYGRVRIGGGAKINGLRIN